MFKSYLLTTFRTLKKNKGYAIINISGLAMGMALCLLGVMYVYDEFTFDSFHEKGDRIFRVAQQMSPELVEGGQTLAVTPAAVGPRLKAEYPEVEEYIRMKAFELIVNREEQTFREKVLFASEPFFNFFSFGLKYGDASSVLSDPGNIVLSESMARKYLGEEDPIGKVFRVQLAGNFEDFTISGVVVDMPYNSSIRFDFMISYQWLVNRNEERYDQNTSGASIYNFVVLNKSASLSQIENKLPAFSDKFMGDRLEESGNPRDAIRHILQPITDMHLNAEIELWPSILPLGIPPGNVMYSYILLSIGFIVLLIACINYVTFSIGYSVQRSREVGVRKVLGADRKNLISQFWGEAFLISLCSIFFALILLYVAVPVFNELFQKELDLIQLLQPFFILSITGIWILVSVIAGMYPSFVMSGFQPSKVLKNVAKIGDKKWLTRSLVTAQYVGAIVLIIGVSLITRQLKYMQSETFSVEDDQVLLIKNQRADDGSFFTSYRQIKNQLAQFGINRVTASYGVTGDNNYWSQLGENTEEMTEVRALFVDDNYAEIFDHNLIKGRFFDNNRGTDSTSAVVVNEAFLRQSGLSNPIGKVVKRTTGIDEYTDLQIIGVVEDFHFESLHTKIEPAVFFPLASNNTIRYISIRQPVSQTTGMLNRAREAWTTVHPGLPFEYSFLDDRLEQLYSAEIRWKNIIYYASAISIFVACLGLLGMTSLSVANRKKEVGIRKVLGASTEKLILLMGKEMMKPVVIAFIIAIPVAYYLASIWLQSFAYKISVGAISFLLAGLAVLLITAATVSYHTVSAARCNPAESLKTE